MYRKLLMLCTQSSQLELKQYVALGLRHVWKWRVEGWNDSSRIVLGEQLATGGGAKTQSPMHRQGRGCSGKDRVSIALVPWELRIYLSQERGGSAV